MMKSNRRNFIRQGTGIMGALTLPMLLKSKPQRKEDVKKIVCIGGHPDDPETGCGGTLLKLVEQGHKITIIYLTTGEAGIKGKSHEESAAIRKSESIKACKILRAKPVFAGQIDGATIVSNEWIDKLKQLINMENPDIVFTQWPIDTHADHQAAGILTIQAWRRSEYSYSIYFYEVESGHQTMVFHPTDYVDISETQSLKRKAVFHHQSQNPQKIYDDSHAEMEKFRGMQMRVKAAEAFVKMAGYGYGELF